MGVVYEDLYDHEGYATGTPHPDARLTRGTRVPVSAYVACCSCGWSGAYEYPLTEDGRDLALAEWEQSHALPLLELAVPASVATAVEQAERAVRDLAGRRPRAARLLLERHERWLSAVTAELAATETGRHLDVPGRVSQQRGR